jgi:glycosyltransferase involved in cell wall biosynthesis
MKPNNSNNPMVSVIIPSYNRGHCIEQTLDTVFKQSYTEFEVIVVDDGSTDDTAQLIKAYRREINYIYQKNAGASAARNTGIDNAKGDWIAFLDSDDEWYPDKLKVQMDDLRTNPGMVAHIVDCNVGDHQETLFSLRKTRTNYEQEPIRQRPLIDVLETQFFTSCWILKKETIKSVGAFNNQLRIFEDIDLLVRIAQQGPFMVNCYVGTHMYRKPGESGALSDLYQSSRQESLKNLIAMYKNLAHAQGLTESESKYIKKQLAGSCLELTVAIGKKEKNLAYYQCLLDALKWDHSPFGTVKVLVLFILGIAGYEALQKVKNRNKKALRRSNLEN